MNTIVVTLWDGKDLPKYSGGAYDTEIVGKVARNFARHLTGTTRVICLADDRYLPGVRELPESITTEHGPALIQTYPLDMELSIGGWSPMLQAFSPDFCEWAGIYMDWHHLNRQQRPRALIVGLDTVVMKNIDWLMAFAPSPIVMPPNPAHGKLANGVCNAVVNYNREGADLVWKAYEEVRAVHASGQAMDRSLMMGSCFSEMQLLRQLWNEHQWARVDSPPARLVSYKYHLRHLGWDLEKVDMVYFHGRPKPQDLDLSNPIRREWELRDEPQGDGTSDCCH